MRFLILLLVILGLGCLGFLWGKADDTMMVWHTELLEEEFSVEKADTIRSFSQYLELEARLFTELKTTVLDHVPVGNGFELHRYSSGSRADPFTQSFDWNRTFEFSVAQPKGGVLLLHGMSDGPYSLRDIGQKLNKNGYWVIGLRLPGHGTAPSGLRSATWQDMAAAVTLVVEHLQEQTGNKPLHLIGYSNGGALALNYTLERLAGNHTVPASLVLISPAIGIHPLAGIAGAKEVLSSLPGLDHLGWLSIEPEFDPFKYNSFATNAGNQVHLITRAVSRRLKQWSENPSRDSFPPVLVFKSTVDATVSVDAVVSRLLRPLQSDKHHLVLFDINRFAAKSSLLVSDPGPITKQLLQDDSLPFELTLITNENDQSRTVVAKQKPPFSQSIKQITPLGLHWPAGVISLSHVALPFAPDDPLYGNRPPPDEIQLYLGQLAIKGERGLLRISSDWLLRLRHNPFYDYLEQETIDWLETHGGG